MAHGVIALLGSGETAPGMTKVHRAIIEPLQPLRAVNLNTTYGFQENVPQMSKKLEDYFSTSLHVDLTTLDLTSFDTASELARATFKLGVREANYVFAGPGSPTHAVAQWNQLELASDLLSTLDSGGTLCFSSAAALTLGAFTAPIYEIYKVGVEPYWVRGLDVLSAFGLECAVIPHFDNNEGGNYDTSRCYLGERRLELLEAQLPPNVVTLGIDEHTAVVLDRSAESLTVLGKSNAYWRKNGETRVLSNGETIALTDLRGMTTAKNRPSAHEPVVQARDEPSDLAELVIAGGPDALIALAQLVKIASTGGQDYIDPTDLIERIIAVRLAARSNGHYDLADQLRDALVDSGIQIADTADGTTWEFVQPS